MCGKVLFTNLRSSQGGAFRVGNPYLPTQLAAWRSVSCGKFLFTNSTAAFRVGNSYLGLLCDASAYTCADDALYVASETLVRRSI